MLLDRMRQHESSLKRERSVTVINEEEASKQPWNDSFQNADSIPRAKIKGNKRMDGTVKDDPRISLAGRSGWSEQDEKKGARFTICGQPLSQ